MLTKQEVLGLGYQGICDLDVALSTGASSHLILEGDAPFYIPEIRRRRPHDRIILRFMNGNLITHDPRRWASRCAEICRRYQRYRIEVIPANEMNIEGGGDSVQSYQHIDNWLVIWYDQFEAEFGTDIPLVHWPGLAPLHGEAEKGYPNCRHSLAVYPVIDVHAYWPKGQALDSPDPNNSAFIWLEHRERFFPNKPVFVSEYNRIWDHTNAEDGRRFADEVIQFLEIVRRVPNVIGTACFLYCHVDPAFADMSWRGQEVVWRTGVWAAEQEQQQEAANMPEFILGFKELADALGPEVVGEPVENEHYWPDGTVAVQTTTTGVLWFSNLAFRAGLPHKIFLPGLVPKA